MKFNQKLKKFFKPILLFVGSLWYYIWKDDSWKGWLFSVAFLFVFIKFVFFPLLSLTTGTALPLAIVESCSMYHEGNLFSSYDTWWEKHETKYETFGVTKEDFEKFPFTKGLNKGDVLFVTGADTKKLKIGDVIIFEAGKQNPLIHRIIKITEDSSGQKIYETIGDNNNGQLSIEKNVQETQIIGKATAKPAPYLGWGKLIFFEFSRNPESRGFCNEN